MSLFRTLAAIGADVHMAMVGVPQEA